MDDRSAIEQGRTSLTAAQVREMAARLVDRHAARLGMDEYGATALAGIIRALPIDAHPKEDAHGKPD